MGSFLSKDNIQDNIPSGFKKYNFQDSNGKILTKIWWNDQDKKMIIKDPNHFGIDNSIPLIIVKEA